MKDCRRIAEQLTPYVDDTLDAADRAEVKQHLDACPPCRTAATEEEGARTILGAKAQGLKSVALPPGLRTRCEALARQHMTPRPRSWRALLPVSVNAVLVVVVAFAALSWITGRSDSVLAAQLTADHSKCYRLFASATGDDVEARDVERMLSERYGWTVHVPPSSPGDGLQLIGARRCLYADGRVPHVMYRVNGQDVSLYVLDGVTRASADLVTLGHRAQIWSRGTRTYVLVAPRDQEIGGAIRYVMREAQ